MFGTPPLSSIEGQTCNINKSKSQKIHIKIPITVIIQIEANKILFVICAT